MHRALDRVAHAAQRGVHLVLEKEIQRVEQERPQRGPQLRRDLLLRGAFQLVVLVVVAAVVLAHHHRAPARLLALLLALGVLLLVLGQLGLELLDEHLLGLLPFERVHDGQPPPPLAQRHQVPPHVVRAVEAAVEVGHLRPLVLLRLVLLDVLDVRDRLHLVLGLLSQALRLRLVRRLLVRDLLVLLRR